MSATLRLPRSLFAAVKGGTVLEIRGETVGECLEHLIALHPELEERLFYARTGDPPDTGAMIRSTVRVSVNGENLGSDGLGTRVCAGDTVEIKLNFH